MSDNNTDPPNSPEEIGKKLEDFIRSQFGGNVLITSYRDSAKDDKQPQLEPPSSEEAKREELPGWLNFRYKPADIKAYLDRYVIRQDEAKKVLATAVCDHYNHARMLRELQNRESGSADPVEFAKQNVIILGPTGVGKTYLVKHIADLIGVPFVKADATKFSETGYVGADVDDLVRELVAKADGNIELAEHGIIYLDEIDKLATSGERTGRDVSGRGVQTALLKLMEETEVPLYSSNDMRSQLQMVFEFRKGDSPRRQVVNTRNILFVASGAFSGLEKVIQRRLSKGSIGFGAPIKADTDEKGMLFQTCTQDFIDVGFEAEFIGRLPVRVVCESLGADDLFDIMKRSAGSLIRQFEREFLAYGIQATFEDSALRVMAGRASEEKTGARGLMTVWEKALRDFKFEMPSMGLREFVVNDQLVNEPQTVLTDYREKARNQQLNVGVMEAENFARQFTESYGLSINFTENAIQALIDRAAREGVTVSDLCSRLYKDYPFGLRLVASNNKEKDFILTARSVLETDTFLSELVVASYRHVSHEKTTSNPSP